MPGTLERWKCLVERFIVNEKEKILPITWYRPIKPTNASRFVIHVILTMGAFHTEYEMFSCGSMRQAFINQRLFDPHHPMKSLDKLVKDYILTQLTKIPCGTKRFDLYVIAAYNSLKELLINDKIALNSTLTVLYTRLHEECNESIEREISSHKHLLIESLHADLTGAGMNDIPPVELLTNANFNNQVEWNVLGLERKHEQPMASYDEQILALKEGKKRIVEYKSMKNYCTKSLCTIGGGGVGKTTIMERLVVFAICSGLNVLVTSLMSERSFQLGSCHLHHFFDIPVHDNKFLPSHIAELAMARLLASPAKLELLRRIDLLMIDELGQVSAQMLSILDLILRRIKRSSVFGGGVLLICTMDHRQLYPINGLPPMLSPNMITSFVFRRMKTSMRANGDNAFLRIQEISRMLPSELLGSKTLLPEFRHLVETTFTFVDSIDDTRIPVNAMFVFGRHQPGRDAETKMLNKIKRIHAQSLCYRKSVDEESTPTGDWLCASNTTKKRLNCTCKEPQQLYFFPNARYEITFNDPKGKFSQAQLAILIEIPNKTTLDSFGPVSIFVAPPGFKSLPDTNFTAEELLSMKWTRQMIGICPNRSHRLSSFLRGCRKQYGLKHHVATTIHAAMGQTLPAIVTQISDLPPFDIWESGQVVVLLSRTKRGENIFFIGDAKSVSKALARALLRESQYTVYISYLLDQLWQDNATSNEQMVISIDHTQLHPYRPMDVPRPNNNEGCVYILVSLPIPSLTYIGETSNINNRLNQHNSGTGGSSTSPASTRPWALLAYVVGFCGNAATRKSFEFEWKQYRNGKKASSLVIYEPDDVAEFATNVISQRRCRGLDEDLRFVRCGTVSKQYDLLTL